MTIASFRRSHFTRVVTVLTLLNFLASFLPPRTAHADPSSIAGIPSGSRGLSGGTAQSSPDSVEEAETVDISTGAAKLSYPFQLPAARGDAQPSLGLVYDSSAGVGFAGVGWTLNLPSVVRKGHAGLPRFTDAAISESAATLQSDLRTDDYYFDGKLLLPVQVNPPLPAGIPASGAGVQQSNASPAPSHVWVLFRAAVDDGSRYFFDGTTWVQQTKSGHLRQFGFPFDQGSAGVELADPSTAGTLNNAPTYVNFGIYRWNLVRDADASGNTVYYVWDDEHQLLQSDLTGAPVHTAGTQYLTDIYDTAVPTSPPPPGPPSPGYCQGPAEAVCGNCGKEVRTCTNNVWGPWSACTNQGVCSPGDTEACPAGGSATCSTSCSWEGCACSAGEHLCNGQCASNSSTASCGASCTPCTVPQNGRATCNGATCGITCNPGYQPSGGQCLPATGAGGATGSLIDTIFSAVEGTAHAGGTPTAIPAPGYAHHVHLTWSLPVYPSFSTNLDSYTLGGTVAPYAYSPIWKALPFAQLSTVDVFSATNSTTQRSLVREYQLSYQYNKTQTRSFLTSVQLVGDCDLVGGIAEGALTAATIAQCVSAEQRPPTTYTYYGVAPFSGSPGSSPTGAVAPPQVLSKTSAYGANAAADFLVDFNGDGVDELVSGLNGLTQYECFATQCSFNESAELLNIGSLGLYTMFGGQLYNCPCGSGTGTVTGPDQYSFGPSSFPASTSNGLYTIHADDSMWTFSIFADWTATGQTSFLEIVPPVLVTNTGFTNPSINSLYLGQFSAPSNNQVQLVGLTGNVLSQSDQNNLFFEDGFSNRGGPPPNLAAGELFPSRALDIDGDGLPDMSFLPTTANLPASVFVTYFSARDRQSGNGSSQITHPFLTANTGWCASPDMDPSQSPWTSNESNEIRVAADFDGDGLLDEIEANKFDSSFDFGPGGPTNYVAVAALPNRGDGRFGTPNDINGEGSGQCWETGASGWGNPIFLGNVPGAPSNVPSDPLSADNMQKSQVAFGDLNGDGMSDYAVLDSSGLSICLRYGGWNDSAFFHCETDPSLPGNDQSNTGIGHATIKIGRVDASGINQVIYFPTADKAFGAPSGTATAVLVSPNGSTADGPRDGLLSTEANGLGAQTSFTYDTVQNLGIGAVPVPVWAVTKTITTNGLSGTQAVIRQSQYAYTGPVYDAVNDLFLGFESVTETRSGDVSGSPGTITATYFATTAEPLSGSQRQVSESYVSRGLPGLVELSDSYGARFTTTAYQYGEQSYYALDGRFGTVLQTLQTDTYLWGDSQTGQPFAGPPAVDATFGISGHPLIPSPAVDLRTVRQFDANGNETVDTDYGLVGSDQTIVHTRIWGLSPGDKSGWNYRVMHDVTGYNNGKTVREYDYTYDALGRFLTLSAPVSGEVQLPGRQPSWWNPWWFPFPFNPVAAGQPPQALTNGSTALLQQVAYDPVYGNVTSSGNGSSPCLRTFVYEGVFNQLPQSITGHPDGSCTNGGLTTSLTFDRRLGLVIGSMDPAGSLTTTGYDDFGRVKEIDQPSILTPGATTAVLYADYADTSPIHSIHLRTGFGLDTGSQVAPTFVDHYRYLDGLGETRAQLDEVDPSHHVNNGSWVLSGVHTSYANGRTHAAFRPIFASGPSTPGSLPPETSAPSSPSASFVYDGLGRVTQAADYNGALSKTTYHEAALSTVYQDAEQLSGSHPNSMTTVTRDGHGRVVTTDAHLNSGPSGSSGDLITTTTYQATGEPLSISQTYPGGSVVRSMQYDSRGYLVVNAEPNAGTWQYAYDLAGRVVGTADARGCGKNVFYDVIGRVVAEDYSPCTSSQVAYTPVTVTPGVFPSPGAEVSYGYDALGRLSAVQDRGRADAYSYNAAGYLAQVVRQPSLPGTSVTYGAEHTKYFDQYSVSGQVMRWGIEHVALATPASGSVTEATAYTYEGNVASVSASPTGAIVQNQIFNPDGSVATTSYGDAAGTTAVSSYDSNGALQTYSLVRSTGPWVNNYGAPPPGDPSLIGDLTDLVISRDMVGNPSAVADTSTAAWPNGAAAISEQLSYWDDYRLHTVSTSPTDGFYNPYAYELASGSVLYPQPTSPATHERLKNLALTYDWRGTVATSTDDADDFFDRSLGTVTRVPGTDQIASAAAGNESLTPTYDQAGNLTHVTVRTSGLTTEYAYTWDEVGNLSSATRYDQLAGGYFHVEPTVVPETYTYASDGSRVRSERPARFFNPLHLADPTYTVNVFDGLVLKDTTVTGDYEDSTSTEQLYFAQGQARVFADTTGTMPVVANGKYGSPAVHTFINMRDSRGSAAFVVDQDTGELVERTAYLAYGALDCDYRSTRWSSPREDYKFGGHWDDSQVGLVYFGARYYSPQLGRFISPDPLSVHTLSGDPNPYEYGNGNPQLYIDPSGLDDESTDSLDYPSAAGASANDSEDGQSASDAPSATPFEVDPQRIGATAEQAEAERQQAWIEAWQTDNQLRQDAAYQAAWRAGHQAEPPQPSLGAGLGAWAEWLRSYSFAATHNSIWNLSGGPGPEYPDQTLGIIPVLAPQIQVTFIGQVSGPSIVVPQGTIGPLPTDNLKGVQYSGGAGGPGLNGRVSGLRIMDPTPPRPPSPGYPAGNATYFNASGQAVNPFTGRVLERADPWWHIDLRW